MLDGRGGLAVAELIFYVPVLPVAIFVGTKHGLTRSSGWFFLIILSVLRIAGSGMELVVETTTDPSLTLIAVAATLSTLGLSPLTLCTLGILKRLHDEMPRKIIQPRIFFLMGVLPIVGLIMAIVGGTDLASGNIKEQSNAVTYLEISSILFIVVVVLEAGVTALTGAQLGQVLPQERKLFYAVAFSLPFLLVRCIYSVVSAYNYTDPTSPFNSHTGSIYVQAFMAVLEEFIVVLAYLTAGILTPKRNAAASAAPQAYKQHSGHQEQGYPAQPAPTYSQQQGYPMQKYPQQQTGSVAV